MGGPPQNWTSYAITAAVILLVMALRLRNVGRHRRVRLEWLWVVPAIFVVLMGATFADTHPSPITLGLCGVALAAGAAIGWQRGRMMHIHVDPETHELNQVTSPAAMVFIVVILLIRFGTRGLVESGVLPVHVDPTAISDVLLSFAVGMFAVARLEMFLRARRLLAEARGARVA